MNRRHFLKAAAVSGISSTILLSRATEKEPATRRTLKKAIMYATIGIEGSVLEKFKAVRDAGFQGIEPMSHMDTDEVLKAAGETGLKLPSVCCSTHWKERLTDPNPSTRERGLRGLQQALRDAHHYGSASVLLVPGVVDKQVSYADAYRRAQEEIRKAIPLAEELKVKIAIENVWNQFLLSPLEAARFVDEFQSPFVGWHFDIGNVVNYGWPEQWIRILGKRIVQLHIKEFSREKRDKEGLWKGFQVEFLKGDNDWKSILKALDEIGYTGWGIAEQPGGNSKEGLKKLSDQMDQIFALPTA